MKFGSFKLGKKDKAAIEEQIAVEETGIPIDELVQGAEPVRPHPPLQELSLDVEAVAAAATGDELLADPNAQGEEEGAPIKLMEVQPFAAAAAAPPPPPPPPAVVKKDAPKKYDPMDLSASIGNIFADAEDEENPLSNLIRSLPDIAATELIDDLKEINDIIKDWQKK